MEEYLMKLTRTNRIQVTKLRTCNNKLSVITSRYQGVIREDRICNKCDAGMLGYEYHVLFQFVMKKSLGCAVCTFQDITVREHHTTNMFFSCKTTV